MILIEDKPRVVPLLADGSIEVWDDSVIWESLRTDTWQYSWRGITYCTATPHAHHNTLNNYLSTKRHISQAGSDVNEDIYYSYILHHPEKFVHGSLWSRCHALDDIIRKHSVFWNGAFFLMLQLHSNKSKNTKMKLRSGRLELSLKRCEDCDEVGSIDGNIIC